jgi:peptidoglycan DL-endopeptidase CwlO
VSLDQRQQGILSHNSQNIALIHAAAQRKAVGGGLAVGGDQQGTIDSNVYNPDGTLDSSRSKALGLASQLIGKTPYVFGGSSAKGIDCSGLVQYVYNQLGYKITQHSAGWEGKNIPGVRTTIDKLRPGDLVAWKDGSHIAIYAGNGRIIEAAHPGTTVRVHGLWSNAVYGIALRLPGE